MEKTQEMVFISPPLLGHIFPFQHFANLLTTLNQHLSVTLLLMKSPFDDKVTKYTHSLPPTSTPRLKYMVLDLPEESYSHLLSSKTFFFDYMGAHKDKVTDYLVHLKDNAAAIVVVDMFTTDMIPVARELGFSSYVFYTSGAAQLGFNLHIQSLNDDHHIDVSEYYNLDVDLHFPTFINPVSSKLLPAVYYDKEVESRVIMDITKQMREAKGIIVNTFFELEWYALRALSQDKSIPKVYTAGPLLNTVNREEVKSHAVIKWLDLQPDSSVVFLCFGSQGWFEVEQIKEIALALEKSGHRFLWSLRRPVDLKLDDKEDRLNDILPEGYLQRTADIGQVIGWAPQLAVLSHAAVGGFVSHCGWNSTLESIWCGVPMAAWPLYAEQNTNALQIVKDIGIGVEIKLDYRNDPRMKSTEIVSAKVIEDSVRRLMDPENNEYRKKVQKLKEESRSALKEGGSSYDSLSAFLNEIVDN